MKTVTKLIKHHTQPEKRSEHMCEPQMYKITRHYNSAGCLLSLAALQVVS